jgi:hypothetical protein
VEMNSGLFKKDSGQSGIVFSVFKDDFLKMTF